MNIIIIQNTNYHFEVVLGLYSALEDIGYTPYIYRYIEKDRYNQDRIINKLRLNLATDEILRNKNTLCGIIVSAYPNPQVSVNNPIPNYKDKILDILSNRILYISHRFKNQSDYQQGLLNKNNSLTLSPLSQSIGIDYMNIYSAPMRKYNSNNINQEIKITIQGHFEYRNRDLSFLMSNIDYYLQKQKSSNKKIIINILGSNTKNILSFTDSLNKQLLKISNIEIRPYNNMDEENFYSILNRDTDWIMSLITPETNRETYIKERFSSNFYQSLAFNKPIICHPIFKNIYNIPGYYSRNKTALYAVSRYGQATYNELVNSFIDIKYKKIEHNKQIFQSKLHNVI